MTYLHPLEPLSAAEVERAVALLRTLPEFTPATRVISVMLKEPPKDLVHVWPAIEISDREAPTDARTPKTHQPAPAFIPERRIARGGWMSVSRPHSAAFVAANDAPLIGARAPTRGRSATERGDERRGDGCIRSSSSLANWIERREPRGVWRPLDRLKRVRQTYRTEPYFLAAPRRLSSERHPEPCLSAPRLVAYFASDQPGAGSGGACRPRGCTPYSTD
jgi:hypothetical protein